MAVTMDDVARLDGVSKASVSRALAHSPLVSEAARKRVLDDVARSSYRINRNARRLRKKRTNAIAVFTDLAGPYALRVAASPMTHTLLSHTVRALAMREKAVMLLPADAASPLKCQSMLAEKSVDGFIFLMSRDKDLLNMLHTLDVPFGAWDGDQAQEPHLCGHRRRGVGGTPGRVAPCGPGMQRNAVRLLSTGCAGRRTLKRAFGGAEEPE